MFRRDLLRLMAGAGAAAACPLCVGRSWAADAAHWSYDGETGPAQWSNLDPGFSACSVGSEQSPVNLADGVRADLAPVQLDYKPMALHIVNNGHTIQVNAEPGSVMRMHGETYRLKQFHFHHPSEHLLAGRALDMELHLVHDHPSGQLAVLGVFMMVGNANPVIDTIWRIMPTASGSEQSFPDKVNPTQLIPDTKRFYRYEGSLTTPPCSEIVTWTVLKTPLEISADQLALFAKLYPLNARPVAGANRRYLLEAG